MAMKTSPSSLRSIIAIWRWPTRVWCVLAPLLLFVGYPLSFAPACWMMCRSRSGTELTVLSVAYRPVAESVLRGPLWYTSFMRWSIQQGLPAGVTLEDDPEALVFSFPRQGYASRILCL